MQKRKSEQKRKRHTASGRKERAEEKLNDTDKGRDERSSREVECIQSEACSFSVRAATQYQEEKEKAHTEERESDKWIRDGTVSGKESASRRER
jgi:hypothetical protein